MKRIMQGLTAGGESPAVLPNKRVEALRGEAFVPKKAPTLRDFFMRVTARDLLNIDGRHFDFVCEESRISETIDVLAKNKLISIPVKNIEGDFVGVFCVYDLIDQILSEAAGAEVRKMALTEPYQLTLHFQTLLCEERVKDVPLTPWVTVRSNATLLDCLAKLGSHSTHLLGVLGEHNEVIGILHRIQILKFLEYNKEMAKDIMHYTIQTFKHLQQSVTLSDHQTVKPESIQELFRSMWQKVMDGDMVCYGHSSVDKFINLLSQVLSITGELPEPDYDTVKETDTMDRVFGLIIKANTASTKLLVLDSHMKPVGTLCFCAVLNELYHIACGCVKKPLH